MKTAAGETAATVAEVISTLQAKIDDGTFQPDDVFITSKDPEGNGFVAFIGADIEDASRVAVVENRNRYQMIFDIARVGPGAQNAVVAMAMFEIDPEF